MTRLCGVGPAMPLRRRPSIIDRRRSIMQQFNTNTESLFAPMLLYLSRRPVRRRSAAFYLLSRGFPFRARTCVSCANDLRSASALAERPRCGRCSRMLQHSLLPRRADVPFLCEDRLKNLHLRTAPDYSFCFHGGNLKHSNSFI